MKTEKLQCWTCGRELKSAEDSPCLRDGIKECQRIIVVVRAPENPPPRCSPKIAAEEGPVWGPCCICRRMVEWKDWDDYVKGTCPHCGASGEKGRK